MAKKARRRALDWAARLRRKLTKKVAAVPPKGPPTNLRPGGPHKDRRIDVLEREIDRELRSDEVE